MNVPSSYHLCTVRSMRLVAMISRHSRLMNVSVDCEALSFDPDIVRGQGGDSLQGFGVASHTTEFL